MREHVSTVLELLGLALLVAGFYLLAPWLGIAVAGALLTGLGFLISQPEPKGTET